MKLRDYWKWSSVIGLFKSSDSPLLHVDFRVEKISLCSENCVDIYNQRVTNGEKIMVEKNSIVIQRVELDKPNFFDRKITSNNGKNNKSIFC